MISSPAGIERIRREPGYTLIELMAVVALIGLLGMGGGLALQRGDRSLALEAGREILGAAVAAARSRAAVDGRNAALVVHADPRDSSRYLAAVAVAVRSTGNGTWDLAGDWAALPPAIAIVPPVAPTGDWIREGTNWSGLASDALASTAAEIGGVSCWVLSFTPFGTVSGGGGNLVLAPVTRRSPAAATPLVFDEPDAVRGLAISTYGVATLVHDRSGF